VLEVTEPGLLTTVQDGGRPDAVDLGVPIGGACDPWAMAAANAMVGNVPGAAVLEMTALGATFRVLEDCLVGVAGSQMGGRSGVLRRGQTLAFGPAADGTGIRTYLAIAGGVDVPVVLGSRSTCLVGGFGGLDGRPLRVGDVIRAGAAAAGVPRSLPGPRQRSNVVGVVRGLEVDAFDELVSARWSASARGDRQGIRLDGPRLSSARGSMLSRGVTWGTVQLPPDGQPIVLLADAQTVGGYPVVAVVITADRPVIGQLGPGDELRFKEVTIAQAQQLLRDHAPS
jgi:biotin-dependent carboxylase-like uncharacterized protein